jgi:hypothetical protein
MFRKNNNNNSDNNNNKLYSSQRFCFKNSEGTVSVESDGFP